MIRMDGSNLVEDSVSITISLLVRKCSANPLTTQFGCRLAENGATDQKKYEDGSLIWFR